MRSSVDQLGLCMSVGVIFIANDMGESGLPRLASLAWNSGLQTRTKATYTLR